MVVSFRVKYSQQRAFSYGLFMLGATSWKPTLMKTGSICMNVSAVFPAAKS